MSLRSVRMCSNRKTEYRTPVTLSWNTFLVKFQFTLLLSCQSIWNFWRRKLYRTVIYHVNGCFIQCLCMKIFTFKKTFQLRHIVPNLKHFYLLCLILNISQTTFLFCLHLPKVMLFLSLIMYLIYLNNH